jgi:hypothetical protein
VKLEFFRVLIGRNAREMRIAVRSLDTRKRLREYRQPYRNQLPPNQTMEFTIRKPGRNHGTRNRYTLAVNCRRANSADSGIGGKKFCYLESR